MIFCELIARYFSHIFPEGRTGVPFVDANMRELALTGFMSNRGRQNVASFLTKDLCLDWRLGAEWFEYLLVRSICYSIFDGVCWCFLLFAAVWCAINFHCHQVDHDVCSNYGNWLYSAGIGNDPRENRKFNMIKQGLDYDNNVSSSLYRFLTVLAHKNTCILIFVSTSKQKM